MLITSGKKAAAAIRGVCRGARGGSFDALAKAGEIGAHGFGVVAGDDVL